MRATRFALAVLCLAALGHAAQPQDERVGRYMGYKFGMFIHWGPYSLASVEASWPIMRPERMERGVIGEAEYRLLPTRFNPVKFDPRRPGSATWCSPASTTTALPETGDSTLKHHFRRPGNGV